MDICGKLLSLIEVLNDDDDGIKMNQKLRHIISALSQECDTVKCLREFITQITARSLDDSEFAIKVAILTSSHSFNVLEMFSQRVVALFLRELQKIFDNTFEKKHFNEDKFYNYVTLLGEFYNRARLSNGKPVDALGLPIINCLQLFLKSKNIKSADCLCSQLHTIGPMLLSSFPDYMKALMLDVRMTLLECRDFRLQAYYLLAIDLVNNGFVLDEIVGKFYTDIIDNPTVDIKQSNSNDLNCEATIIVEGFSCQLENNISESKKATENYDTTNELADQRVLQNRDINTIEDPRPSKVATSHRELPQKCYVNKNESVLKDNKKSAPTTKPSINDRLKYYRNKNLGETTKTNKEEIKNTQRNVITKTEPDNTSTSNSVFSDALSQIFKNLDVSKDSTPNSHNRKGSVQRFIKSSLNKAEEGDESQYLPRFNISDKPKHFNVNSNASVSGGSNKKYEQVQRGGESQYHSRFNTSDMPNNFKVNSNLGSSGGSNKKYEQVQRVSINERLKIHRNSNQPNTDRRDVHDIEKNISGSSDNRKRDKEFDNQKKVNNHISNWLKIKSDSNTDSSRSSSSNNSREDLKITSTPVDNKLRINFIVQDDRLDGTTIEIENSVPSIISPIADTPKINSTRKYSSIGTLLGSRSYNSGTCNNSTKSIGRGRGRFQIANAIASVGVNTSSTNVSTRNITTGDSSSNCSVSSNASGCRPKAVSSVKSRGRGKWN